MAEKRNLVEEALLQMKNLEEAVNENAKGILASTMKEEINELVKESLSEEEEIEDEMVSIEMEEGDDMKEGQGHEMTEQEEDETEIEVEDEEELELPDLDTGEEDDEMELDLSDEGEEDLMDMLDLPDNEMEDEEEFVEPLDLTGISDEELLKVFKAMGEEDGIIVKQDDDEIHLKDESQDTEYIIQTEAEEDKDVIADEEEMEGDYKEGYEMDEIVYEIELSEDEDESDEDESEEEMHEGQGYDDREDERLAKHGKIADKDLKSMKARRDDAHFETREGEMEETARSNASLRKFPNAKSAPEQVRDYASDRLRPAVKENNELKKELKQLREKNEEYRKALNIFKEKLNEVAVFNSNLAYATRLFTENTTTKQEKINILRRFDSVETLKESKSLYRLLKEEFNSKNDSVVTENVKAKVAKSPTKGSASNLIESKTYENPQFMRMKDLMNKLG